MHNDDQMDLFYNIQASSIQLADTIGRGSFGAVRRATVVITGKRIRAAVKLLSDLHTGCDKEAIENEIQILRRTVHRNIIGMYGCFRSTTADPGIGIVLELMSCSLNDLLYSFTYVQYRCSQALDWMLQCAMGVAYLHERSMIHRDLKPANMLLDKTFRILKVSDFGTARFLETRMTVCQGTTSYMAPEVMVGREYDARCDIYSIGVVLGELMTRRRPENSLGTIAAQILYRVPKGARPDISSACCADISRLVNKCWLKEPKNRPHIEDVLDSLTKLIEIRRKHPSSAHLIVGKEDDAHKICSLEEIDHIVKEYVHIGVICRGCKAIVRGRRFRCTECDNYDICEKCSSAGRHKQHITFRFDRPYRDEPRFIDEEMFSMEKLMVKLKNGRRLTLAYAAGKRPHHFFLNFVSQKRLIEYVEDDPSVEQISEDDHLGAYYSDKRQRLDVVLRDMKTATDAISFILQALDFNQTVVISAEENVEEIVEGILKTIVLLSITEDFRKVECLVFYSADIANLKAVKRAVESTLFSKAKG